MSVRVKESWYSRPLLVPSFFRLELLLVCFRFDVVEKGVKRHERRVKKGNGDDKGQNFSPLPRPSS